MPPPPWPPLLCGVFDRTGQVAELDQIARHVGRVVPPPGGSPFFRMPATSFSHSLQEGLGRRPTTSRGLPAPAARRRRSSVGRRHHRRHRGVGPEIFSLLLLQPVWRPGTLVADHPPKHPNQKPERKRPSAPDGQPPASTSGLYPAAHSTGCSTSLPILSASSAVARSRPSDARSRLHRLTAFEPTARLGAQTLIRPRWMISPRHFTPPIAQIDDGGVGLLGTFDVLHQDRRLPRSAPARVWPS